MGEYHASRRDVGERREGRQDVGERHAGGQNVGERHAGGQDGSFSGCGCLDSTEGFRMGSNCFSGFGKSQVLNAATTDRMSQNFEGACGGGGVQGDIVLCAVLCLFQLQK